MTPFVKNLFLSTCCVYAYDVKKIRRKEYPKQGAIRKLDQGLLITGFCFHFLIGQC